MEALKCHGGKKIRSEWKRFVYMYSKDVTGVSVVGGRGEKTNREVAETIRSRPAGEHYKNDCRCLKIMVSI